MLKKYAFYKRNLVKFKSCIEMLENRSRDKQYFYSELSHIGNSECGFLLQYKSLNASQRTRMRRISHKKPNLLQEKQKTEKSQRENIHTQKHFYSNLAAI
jgi:hypothetical protein